MLFFTIPLCIAQDFFVHPYIQDLHSDSVWILWEDDQSTNSELQWGSTNNLGELAQGTANEVSSGSFIHSVQINGLSPSTSYYYQVTSSNISSFRTTELASSEASLSLVAMSDMQIDSSNPNKFREIVEDGIISHYEQMSPNTQIANLLDAVLIPGDLVENGYVHSQWQEDFFEPAASLLAQVPVYPVPGNHENDAQYFFDYFHLPEDGYEEHWWSRNLSNLRIIGLDSNSTYRIEAQITWLEANLADACYDPVVDFVFVQLHHPHHSELWTSGNTSYTGEVIAILEEFSTECEKPSVHFFGHTHGYSRGQSQDHRHVMLNVASGGGNIDYWGEYVQNDYPEYSVSQDEYGFVVMDVQAGAEPEFTIRRYSQGNEQQVRDNELRDELTIRLFNTTPNTPRAIFPVDEQVSPDCLYLVASNFEDEDDDFHADSHWQVSNSCTDFSNPVITNWRHHQNWYNGENTQEEDDLQNETISLEEEQSYCWRVRYRDQSLSWSEWSEATSFSTTVSNYSPNLLVNGGAENGTDSWSVQEGILESLSDGECNGVTPYSGTQYFSVGGLCEESDYAEAIQSIDVRSYESTIRLGAYASISGQMRTWSGSDKPTAQLTFFDQDDNELARSDELSTLSSSWHLVGQDVIIPIDTVRIDVLLTGTRNNGSDNDSYIDELSVRIREGGTGCDGEDIIDEAPQDTAEPGSEPSNEPDSAASNEPDSEASPASVPDDTGNKLEGDLNPSCGCSSKPVPFSSLLLLPLIGYLGRRRH